MKNLDDQTIDVSVKGQSVRIALNRPKVHNAFNSVMIGELLDAFERAGRDKSIRVIVLTGTGSSFCSGADLNWMRRTDSGSLSRNRKEALRLTRLLRDIYLMPKPVIARVNGTAVGGGAGLFCACDIAVAAETAMFGLSQIKVGIVPAAVTPYILRKIGESRTREYLLTGERFTARRAEEIGLINTVVPPEKLDEKMNSILDEILSAGPKALLKCKEAILKVSAMTLEEAGAYGARVTADLPTTPEGREGIAAFLEKRKPKWMK